MSLKIVVLVLILANAGYAAYSQGWLASLLGTDSQQREPTRMSKQINPSSVLVIPASDAAALAVASNCVSAKPIDNLPAAERWIVYMGPYANKDLLDKKKAELTRIKVNHTEVSKPALKMGLSLGDFSSELAARAAIDTLAQQGIRTATILLWSTGTGKVSQQTTLDCAK
jgi:hypothetical protein